MEVEEAGLAPPSLRSACSFCPSSPRPQVERDHGGGAGGPAAALSSSQLGLPQLLHGYELFLAGVPRTSCPCTASLLCFVLATARWRLAAASAVGICRWSLPGSQCCAYPCAINAMALMAE